MSVIDDIKGQLDIVAIVGERVPLTKAGRNFKASCPFHTERTPSFYVFPERGTWRCFGACATGGDLFSFLQRAENITFAEALRRLADRTGVTLPTARVAAQEEQAHRVLFDLNQEAADYFHRILVYSPAGEQTLRYLASRGISRESITRFQLGLSPKGWEILKNHLRDRGYAEADMLQAGLLVSREEGGTYDRFRERLMFPIRDAKGRHIGFGARSLDDSLPKYLNSPQSPVFDKSGVLYALDAAQEGVRASGQAVIVEGYMDALQAHQSGFTNVVTAMGTSLTERQVGLLKGLAIQFLLALDPDAAGEEATRRSLEGAWNIFQRVGVAAAGVGVLHPKEELPDLRIISLPSGKDPDELIRQEPEEWLRRVAAATPILDYLFSWEASRPEAATPAGKQAIVERLFPLISALKNPFEQSRNFHRLAEALGVPERDLEAAIGRPRARGPHRGRTRPPQATASALQAPEGDPLEEHLLALVLRWPDLLSTALETVDLRPDHFQRPENVEAWRVLSEHGSSEALFDASEPTLQAHGQRLLGLPLPPLTPEERRRAILETARRLDERHIKRLNEEAIEAVARLPQEVVSSDAPFVAAAAERNHRLKELHEQGRWGRWRKEALEKERK